jgi:hypothetical protein
MFISSPVVCAGGCAVLSALLRRGRRRFSCRRFSCLTALSLAP